MGEVYEHTCPSCLYFLIHKEVNVGLIPKGTIPLTLPLPIPQMIHEMEKKKKLTF